MTDDQHLPGDPTRTEGEGETLDMPEGMRAFTPGQVLGERYQILEMLGRGGMGEVWHAFDLKLRVEVALKALRPEFFKSDRRLELLRQEVRAAREVVSPNVCRIFDLIEVEGRELVSMEYVDGATLLGVLQERGPLELKEAQDIASQFLAGLEAIHKAGLIHRDIKPENIMLTRAGRVVVMDFGLARQETEGGGTVAGTPAYMAPEQAAGQTLDARADVYAAGVVLAEMVSPDGHQELRVPAERLGGRALRARQGPRHAVGSGDPEGRQEGPRGPLQLRPHPDPRPRGRDPPSRRRRRPPPLPRSRLLHRSTTPSTSSAARPRSSRCGASSRGRLGCSVRSGLRGQASPRFIGQG